MLKLRWIFTLVALTIIHHSFANIAAGTITLGISVTVGNASNTRAQQGVQVLRGLNFWLSKINSAVLIRGQIYQLELKILTDDGTVPAVLRNYDTLIGDSSVDYLLGPIGSDVSNPLSKYLNGQPRVLLGTSVGSKRFIEYNPYALSVVTTASRCPLVSFPYFRLHGAKRIAFIISQYIDSMESCGELTDVQVSTAARAIFFLLIFIVGKIQRYFSSYTIQLERNSDN
jgi:ABC-type branched-subunit amino acid transport system substrate-binding protein